FVLVDVGAGAEPGRHSAGLIAEGGGAGDVPAPGLADAEAELQLDADARGEGVLPLLQGGGEVVGVDGLLPTPADGVGERQAGLVAPALVEVVGGAIGAGGPDEGGDVLGE